MEKAPYTPSPKNVTTFFEAIPNLGLPPKVDNEYLKTIKFTSSYDRPLIGVGRFLGFIDSDGSPTQRWKDFRDKKNAGKVMADAIKDSYANLYQTFPNAEKRDGETLKNYFASTSGLSGSVANYMLQTFRNLCRFADFQAVAVAVAVAGTVTEPTAPATKKVAEMPAGTRPVTFNINIELSLPATEDASIYDSLFAALRKHLLP